MNKDNNHKLDYCLDLALCNSIIPQISKLPPIELLFIYRFLRRRISGKIWADDYMDNDSSQKKLKEVKKLVSFINDHKDEKEKLHWDRWSEYLNGTKKDRENKLDEIDENYRTKEAQKHNKKFNELDQKEQAKISTSLPSVELKAGNLDPWTAIIDKRKLKNIKNPALHEFNNALKQIIKERSFEDFVDEFDD